MSRLINSTDVGTTAGGVLSAGTSNINRQNLKVWSMALGRVRRNEGRAIIALEGDSTQVGYGAGSGGPSNVTGARPYGVPNQLAQALTSMGLSAECNSWFASHGMGTMAILQNYDARLVFGAGWSLAAQNTVGGTAVENVSGTDAMTFSPVLPFDTVRIFYAQETGYGDFDILIDGVKSGATVSSGGATALGVATRTTTLGVHVITVQRTGTGGRTQLMGMDPYRTDKSVITVLDTPWGGSQTTSWLDTNKPYSSASMLTTLAPDLIILNLGLNDRGVAGRDATTYQTNIATLVARALNPPGSCILCNPTDSNDASWPHPELKAPYLAAVQAVSVAQSVPLFDLTTWIGSYASNSAEYFDNVHLKKNLYGVVAAGLANIIVGMGLAA